MKKLLNIFYTIFKRASNASGSTLVLWTLIAVVVFSGGKYFLKNKQVNNLSSAPFSSPPSPVAEIIETQGEEEEEEQEEEETGDDEESSNHKSPWTLLQTGLPSRYFEPPAKKSPPSVTIILTNLGLRKSITDHVLTTLHGPFTISFNPDSPNLVEQCRRASSLGYTVLVALPMEPYNFPDLDPGPYTLLTGLPPETNIERTKAILDKSPKEVGIIGMYGSCFTQSKNALAPVLKELKSQGRLFIDPNSTLHSQVQQTCEELQMPYRHVDLTLPITTTADQVDEFLKKIIQSAKENGNIIVSVPAIRVVIDRLPSWLSTFNENGIELVPMTNLKTTDEQQDTH